MTAIRALIAQGTTAAQVAEPPIARFLFADTRMAVFWLVVRVYVGWQWLQSGIEKLEGPTGSATTPAWR